MPQLTAVVLKDRANPVVSHTFSPVEIKDGRVGILEKSSGVPLGNYRLGISRRKTGSRNRVTLTLQVPVVATETVNGVSNPVLIRTSYATLNLSFDNKSTLQERKDTVAMLESALASSQSMIDAVVTGLESVY